VTTPAGGEGAAHDATAYTEPGPEPGRVDAETVRRHEEEAMRAVTAVDRLREKVERLREHLRAAEDSLPDHQAEADAPVEAHETVRAKFEAQQSGAEA
jgi:hypothetical protein